MSSESTPPKGMQLWHDMDVGRQYRNTMGDKKAGPMTGPAIAMLEAAGLLSPSLEQPIKVFDNAAGPGTITGILLEIAPKKDVMEILCGDWSESMVNAAKERGQEESWTNVEFKVVDAQDTKLPSDTFTHVVVNFGIMLMADPAAALSECYRILKPNGVLAFNSWHHVGWPPLVQLGLDRLQGAPNISRLEAQMSNALKWGEPDFVLAQLAALPADRQFISVTSDILPRFEIHWQPEDWEQSKPNTLMMQKLVVMGWTDEEKEKYADKVLPAAGAALREKYLGETVPVPFQAILTVARKPAA